MYIKDIKKNSLNIMQITSRDVSVG